jgi:hypothetical protein
MTITLNKDYKENRYEAKTSIEFYPYRIDFRENTIYGRVINEVQGLNGIIISPTAEFIGLKDNDLIVWKRNYVLSDYSFTECAMKAFEYITNKL